MTKMMIAAAMAAATAAVPATAQFAQWATAKPGKPVAFVAGQALPPELLKRNKKDDLSGTSRVVIPYFQVQFVTASKKSSNRTWASLSQSYALEGLSQGQMQAITDALYDKFAAALTAQGLSVVGLEEARAQSPNLAKLLTATQPAPFTGKTSDGTVSTIMTAKGLPIYFHIGDPERGSMANIGSRAYWDQPAAAKELNAALVGVRLAVNFVEQASSDKRGLLGIRSSTAKVQSNVSLTIEPLSTHVWIQGPKKQASIIGQPVEPVRYYLTSPLIVPDGAVTDVSDATTAGQKRSDTVSTAFSALLGQWQKNSNKAFVVTVDPAIFREQVGGAMESVDTAMAGLVMSDLTTAR